MTHLVGTDVGIQYDSPTHACRLTCFEDSFPVPYYPASVITEYSSQEKTHSHKSKHEAHASLLRFVVLILCEHAHCLTFGEHRNAMNVRTNNI